MTSSLTQRLAEHAHDLNEGGHHPYSSLPSGNDVMTLAFVMDGHGSVIAVGPKGAIPLFFNCLIEGVTLLADITGSVVVDIYRDSYSNYPNNSADSITNAHKPTLSGAITYNDTVLTGWNTVISGNNVLSFNIDSVSTITKLTVALKLRKV